MSKLTVTCTAFRAYRQNTLCGFAVIRVAEMRLTIRDVSIHEKGGARWAQMPAKPLLKNGAPVMKDGKVQYAPILELDNKAVRDAFSCAVVAAVLDRFPTAFGVAA
jgi:hypothetical protein